MKEKSLVKRETSLWPERLVDTADPGSYGIVVSSLEGCSFVHTEKYGDVFVPKTLPFGLSVTLRKIGNDDRRGGTAKRAEIVEPVKLALPFEQSDFIKALSSQTNFIHLGVKRADPFDLDLVAANKPFGRFLENAALIAATQGPRLAGEQLAEHFLKNVFANLQTAGVRYALDQFDEKAEKQSFAEYQSGAQSLPGVSGLQSQFALFMKMRRLLVSMKKAGALNVGSIMPRECLLPLVMAAPVAYVYPKEGLVSQSNEQYPLPDAWRRYVCSLFGANFANLWQIYNCRTRTTGEFPSFEPMPAQYQELFQVAAVAFPYLFILTPYLSLADEELTREWPQMVDPFLVGLLPELPDYVFVLARWGGRIFPLVCDMIASTLRNLESNRANLAKFHPRMLWCRGQSYAGEPVMNSVGLTEYWRELRRAGATIIQPRSWLKKRLGVFPDTNTVLRRFCDQLVAAFNEFKGFEFLKA